MYIYLYVDVFLQIQLNCSVGDTYMECAICHDSNTHMMF